MNDIVKGLTQDALDYLERNGRKYKISLGGSQVKHERLQRHKVTTVDGYCGDKIILYRYYLKNGQTIDEIVQVKLDIDEVVGNKLFTNSNQNGSVFFKCLQTSDGKRVAVWSKEKIQAEIEEIREKLLDKCPCDKV